MANVLRSLSKKRQARESRSLEKKLLSLSGISNQDYDGNTSPNNNVSYFVLPSLTVHELEKAMDYLVRHHPNFDGVELSKNLDKETLDKIKDTIDICKNNETPNFIIFDKCPSAIIHFVRDYILTYGESLISEDIAQSFYSIMREIDPRDRIGRLKEIITKNKNRVIIKCLMANLHKILVNSSDKKSTIDHMVYLFSDIFFKIDKNNIRESTMEQKFQQKQRKQRKATTFLIQRADVILNFEVKIEKDDSLSLRDASRKLGTDGTLYLLEQEVNLLSTEIGTINYNGLLKELIVLEEEIEALHQKGEDLIEKKDTFEKDFLSQLQELQSSIEQIPVMDAENKQILF